ncbi:MAG: FKBP-type peptidyl-prolyl cis-trans isomerase [Coprobacter sp.]|nr:FKBP-type peptidyl-prolyl cis-trans isomerase [Coprobacter sp.]
MKSHILIFCCLFSISAFAKKSDKVLTTPADSLGYAFGILNGAETADGLKALPYPVDMKAFVKGMNEVMSTDTAKRSYEMGLFYGYRIKDQLQQMKKQGIKIDKEACQKALAEIFNSQTVVMEQEQAEKIWVNAMNNFREEKMQQEAQMKKAEAENNLLAGKEFLAQKEKEPGVIKTPTGLLYKVIEPGEGDKITADCKVKAHYVGKLIDGTVFDSSYERGYPLEFRITDVIKGWTEGLQFMRPGSKYILYIPSGLAYGETGSGDTIKPNSVLEFEVEIVEVLRP